MIIKYFIKKEVLARRTRTKENMEDKWKARGVVFVAISLLHIKDPAPLASKGFVLEWNIFITINLWGMVPYPSQEKSP